VNWKQRGGRRRTYLAKSRILNLSDSEWKERVSNLKRMFGQHKSLPVGTLNDLQEDAERSYVVTVLEKENNRMKTAVVMD
jgi:hypothetical protein